MNAVNHILAEANGTRQDRQQLRPRQLPQEPDERITCLGEVGRNLPCGLWRRCNGHAPQNERRDGEIGRDKRRGVKCVEVEADVEQLVAEAEEEERSLDKRGVRR